MIWESFRCLLANSRRAVMCLLLRSGFRLATLPYRPDGGVLEKWLSFWKVLLSPQSNAGALSEWPPGSWSPPWLRPFYPHLSEWTGGQLSEEFWWFQTSYIYGWWRPLEANSFNFMSWFVLWHALSTMGPHDQSTEFTQVKCNQVVETSEGWSVKIGCTWAHLRVMANVANTNVNVLFLFFILNEFAKVSKKLFFTHYGVLCVEFWGKR